VNKLLKMHQEMANAMKKIKKMGGLKGLAAMFGKGGDLGQLPGGMGDMLGGMKAPPGGLPGLGGGLPPIPGNLPPGFDKFLKKR
jgi:signal recognition particle subunit SRP54